MIVKDKELLAEFRHKTRCEWCGRSCQQGVDPHHIIKRGLGGGNRLDVRTNLVGLCRGFDQTGWVSCHDEADKGEITKAELFAVVAKREGLAKSPKAIEAALRRLLRK